MAYDTSHLLTVGHAKTIYDNLKSAMQTKPDGMESDGEDIDLDVTDTVGNVLARFSEGHLKTANFDSRDTEHKPTDSDASDFDITDQYGNVILRLQDGHIKTAKFHSKTDSRIWHGKKWTVIGDSLSNAYSRTLKHYHEYIADRTGITVENLGQSEGGYYARPNDRTFRLQADLVPLDSDAVTIFGSGNDVQQITAGTITLGEVTDTTDATVCGCINITLENIYAHKPVVSLGIITPTPWTKTNGSVNWTPENHGNPLELYVDALVEICRRRSIPCLDLYHMSNLRPADPAFRAAAYSRDGENGIHPDEKGHLLIVPQIEAFLASLIV